MKFGEMRPIFLKLHRWLGLATAVFLIMAGLTGAIISWDHELDEWLNPSLMFSYSSGQKIAAAKLIEQVSRRYPNAQVTYFPLAVEKDHSFIVSVMPKLNPATGRLYTLGFNQIFLDPVTGKELGKREWGAIWPLDRTNLVSFLYKLHYSLHLPEIWKVDRWGIWLLGGVAILWLIDSFIGFYLTLPIKATVKSGGFKSKIKSQSTRIQKWKSAWNIRWGSGRHKRYFDLHRAFGLWTWLLLIILAFSAVALNLRRELFMPVMHAIFEVSPSPYDLRPPIPLTQQTTSSARFDQLILKAELDAKGMGWQEPVGSIFYSPHYQLFTVDFYFPGADHGVGGAGHKQLYYDSQNAAFIGKHIPWQGTLGDLLIQAQFPLHSGRILGLTGRILISLMGLIVAMLSATGVYLWWKKQRARNISKHLSAKKRLIGLR